MKYVDIPNIVYKQNSEIDSSSSWFALSHDKDADYLSNPDALNNFIKACEKTIRTNKRYTAYKAYLHEVVGLDKCDVLGELDTLDCTIEMHHGPILTLYDYCSIVIDLFLLTNRKVNTFTVAKRVLDDHWENIVRVVMLSTTIHEEVTNRNIFIDYRQGFGDMPKFIRKYDKVINSYYKNKILTYIDKSILMENENTDQDLLKINKLLLKGE